MPLTTSQKSYVIVHYPTMTVKDMALALGVSYTAVRAYIDYHHIKSGRQGGTPKGTSRVFTPEEQEYIHSHYKGTSPTQMTEELNSIFHKQHTKIQIIGYYNHNRLSSGVTGQFPKGHPSYTKGKKQEDYMTPERLAKVKAVQFKKGHDTPNRLPIGTEVKNSNGYWEVKVAMPNVWKKKHTMIYENAYGAINKDEVVIFLDGNKDNLSLDNLQKVTKSECVLLNKYRLRHANKELTNTGIAVLKLKNAIKRRQKNDEHIT